MKPIMDLRTEKSQFIRDVFTGAVLSQMAFDDLFCQIFLPDRQQSVHDNI